MIKDEHYLEGPRWQLRNCLDRRFWHTSGGWPAAIHFGIVDDFGDIVRTFRRPFDG